MLLLSVPRRLSTAGACVKFAFAVALVALCFVATAVFNGVVPFYIVLLRV